MDNICHTLVGAAMGEAGLKRRARLAMPALLIAANLPDIDVLAYVRGPVTALGFRRGWTHGPVGLLVLTCVLAAIMAGFENRLSNRRGEAGQTAGFGRFFLLSLAAMVTHPVLDFMNNYGVRWLLPADWSWYYGDTLFIVDPWVWIALGIGVAWSRRTSSRHPATVSLALVTAYIATMGTITAWSHHLVSQQLAGTGTVVRSVMVAPVAANPVRRAVLVDRGDRYQAGVVNVVSVPHVVLEERTVPRNETGALQQAAAGTPQGRVFLSWSRFPYFLVDERERQVTIMDARYNSGWASVTVSLK